MKKGLIILFMLLTATTATFSQELRLVVSDKPLNTVLNSLNVEISFDDKALSAYNVSLSRTFKTPEEAIAFLLKDKPFKVEKVGSVYVISSQPKPEKRPESVIKKTYLMAGTLSDGSSGEPLPFAHIQTDKGIVTSDENGGFSVSRDNEKPLRVQIYYLGYETADTILQVGNNLLSLVPKVLTLGEVTVHSSPTAMLMQAGKTSGEMRINHQIARDMPGSADNSVFTLLRMMPGVRASGEPSEDLIVWGSNWGESQLVYDGFTIFGMKSFNDQIGSVNPYLAKDIRLLKGGYGASFGNRIGAIAEVTGNEGNFNEPSVKANISNYTANLFASVPIKKTSALSVAYRQTFYNLYNNTNTGNSEENHRQTTTPDIYIEPKYDFRDLNLKYAGKAFGNDRYYASLYYADDHFESSVTQQSYAVNAAEKNRQYGAATGYNKAWNNGSHSKFLLSFSKLSAAIDNVSGITNNSSAPLDVFHINNSIRELSLGLEHNFNIGERQQVQVGGKWQQYTSSFNDSPNRIDNLSLYITDNIMFGKLSLQAGLRADWIVDNKIYLQPRLSARYAISEELTATASWGLYNQFLTRVPFLYRQGSYQMVWNLSDSTFLSSIHAVAGLAYSKNEWLLSAEAFLKKNQNELFYLDNTVNALDNTLWGTDVYIKKEWRKHTFFGSYSLVKSEMPQESTGQEIKLGAIASFKPFHFSATYVYGTGFPYLSTGGHGHGQENEEQEHGSGHQHSDDVSTEPYSRLDLSLTYKLQLKKCNMQAGVSVLNVFNTNNVKYSYRISDQTNVFNVYTKATPLTPVVFFEIIF